MALPRAIERSSFIGRADPPGSLRSVEHDGEGGPIELVAQLTAAMRQRDGRRESLELQGDAINVEPLEVEKRI